jgi:site-specific DNA recombinase
VDPDPGATHHRRSVRFARRRLHRKRTYLLRGLLKCGHCGYALVGFTQVSRSKYEGPVEYTYYTCTQRSPLRSGRTEACPSKSPMGAGIDEVVWSTVRKLLLDSDALAARLDAWLSRALDAKDDRERLGQAATRLAELQKQRERLIDAYQAGALDLGDFQSRKATIEERTLAVEHECAELNSRESRRELARRQADGARTVAERLREQLHDPEFEAKQAILRLVLDKVVVTGHRLELHLALPVSGDFGLTSDWRFSTISNDKVRFVLATEAYGAWWGRNRRPRRRERLAMPCGPKIGSTSKS